MPTSVHMLKEMNSKGIVTSGHGGGERSTSVHTKEAIIACERTHTLTSQLPSFMCAKLWAHWAVFSTFTPSSFRTLEVQLYF
eukprot:1160563-Pelagomonas_calceolata.AAC.12